MSDLEFSDSEDSKDDTASNNNNGVSVILFNKAADHVQHIHDKITQDNLLQLYAYYKQATHGNCNTSKPSIFQMQARSKWSAWHNVRDMPKCQAMTKYVELLAQLDPVWHEEVSNQSEPIRGWVVHSTLQNTVEPIAEHNKTPFDYVREGNLDQLKRCISSEDAHSLSDLMQQLDEQGMGMVHWATDRNQPHILGYLLKSGAKVDLRDAEQQTALHYAASCGHRDCILVLLAAGADCSARDADNNSCIDVAENAEIRTMLLNATTQ